MKDFCKYVDVFYGNGEVDHFSDTGLASKWYYIKALCGNTVPHATLPFGKMSVGPFSGGYPTGYGNHYPNSCGGIKKLFSDNMAMGFSHLHQSGTGAIQYYYNYAVVSPFCGEISYKNTYYHLENEVAVPGYYSCDWHNIFCEMTVCGGVALHHYRFETKAGRVAIDFSNNGLHPAFGDGYRGSVEEITLEKASDNTIYFSAKMSGVKLYFCAVFEGDFHNLTLFKDCHETEETLLSPENNSADFGAVANVGEYDAYLKVSYSTHSCEEAERAIKSVAEPFDKVC